MARVHDTRSRPGLCKKKENVLASASHAGGPTPICHPSGSIDILNPPPFFKHRKALIVPLHNHRRAHAELEPAICRVDDRADRPRGGGDRPQHRQAHPADPRKPAAPPQDTALASASCAWRGVTASLTTDSRWFGHGDRRSPGQVGPFDAAARAPAALFPSPSFQTPETTGWSRRRSTAVSRFGFAAALVSCAWLRFNALIMCRNSATTKSIGRCCRS